MATDWKPIFMILQMSVKGLARPLPHFSPHMKLLIRDLKIDGKPLTGNSKLQIVFYVSN